MAYGPVDFAAFAPRDLPDWLWGIIAELSDIRNSLMAKDQLLRAQQLELTTKLSELRRLRGDLVRQIELVNELLCKLTR